MQVSFIGLGVMGYPMAGHLQQAGHSVSVYNRTAAKAQAWQQTYGGKTAATPAEAAAGGEDEAGRARRESINLSRRLGTILSSRK